MFDIFATKKNNNISENQSDLFCKFDLFVNVDDFRKFFIKNILKKILQDCVGKTTNLNNKIRDLLFDTIIENDDYKTNKGLLSYIVDALYYTNTNKIIYFYKNVNLISDFEILGKQFDKSVKLNFRSYKDLINLLKQYATLIYNTLESFNTGINITKSLIFKVNKARDVGSVKDLIVDDFVKQGKDVVNAIRSGNCVLVDSGDELETKQFDVKATEETIQEIEKLIAGALGFPLSYITGEFATVIASNNNQEEAVVHRVLRTYWNSWFEPIVRNLLDINLEYKKDILYNINNNINLLNFIETTELFDEEQKKDIVNQILDVGND